MFWTYFVGACFIAAGLSLVTKIQARLAASLLALTFFLFVVLMDAPGLARNPQNRFALALMLRELAFCGGPLALAASLSGDGRARLATSLRRSRATSSPFPCSFTASSNSCTAITFPAFRSNR